MALDDPAAVLEHIQKHRTRPHELAELQIDLEHPASGQRGWLGSLSELQRILDAGVRKGLVKKARDPKSNEWTYEAIEQPKPEGE